MYSNAKVLALSLCEVSVIRHYLRLILFMIATLLGIQVPGFVDQYAKRVDAHWQEANHNLSGFRATAEQFFNGDLSRLVAHYRSSNDPVFVRDADTIAGLILRVERLAAERQHLQAGPIQRVWHVATDHIRPIFEQTLRQYTYVVILAPEAILWGIALAVLISLIGDTVCSGCVRCVRWARHSHS
ncbi:DUF2937 family protein [Aestuariibacter halophilus]|uniref:DUF2937 family protein n=1 Tax=Fluctibacter halophilus TaxID=226011 RepID=A0ABS8GC94_9ALTE|nr:DUF2937 family protein [Aestuariibacter halophilus]MCC2617430.1 DUF2937 family protein [Aestuariibacter halophilus]